MTRKSVLRVLLSLLLLVSQQMAIAHGIAHWNHLRARAEQKPGHDGSASKALAKHQMCDRCLAFAQIAGVVGSAARSFVPSQLVVAAAVEGPLHAAPARTVRPFDSRAPPIRG